jgi:error-prone DNA polymerase
MATFRKTGLVHGFHDKMVQGMIANGYPAEFAERCFKQIEGFGEYGFPESHAASFALLVYVSAWMKCHYPAAFTCALLNSQPMGFYAPAQIVRDAQEHGVRVLPPDVNASDWDCTLEIFSASPLEGGRLEGGEAFSEEKATGAKRRYGVSSTPTPTLPPQGGERERVGGRKIPDPYAIRLGLRQVKGLAEEDARWIVAARANGYAQPADLWRRAGVGRKALKALAAADAFGSLGLTRRQALWAVRGIGGDAPLPLFEAAGADDRGAEPAVPLPETALGEEVAEDYLSLRLSLKAHPLALIRERADGALGDCVCSEDLETMKDGARLEVAGLVLVRQRPGSAKGVIFVTLEDETGVANIVVWTDVSERYRRALLAARLMRVRGKLQREGRVIHLVADRIEDASSLLDDLLEPEAGMDGTAISALAPTDEVRRPVLTPDFRGTGYHPVGSAGRAPARPRPRHPRDQAKTVF